VRTHENTIHLSTVMMNQIDQPVIDLVGGFQRNEPSPYRRLIGDDHNLIVFYLKELMRELLQV
jgi:hypothetical protein